MLQTRSDALIVVMKNTAAGGGAAVTIINSSNLNIANSAGWIVAISNTGGVVAISNTSPLVQVQNSAGWVVTIGNSAGLSGRSSFITMTTVVSTIGLITLLTNNANRLTGSFYNDSTVPLYLKLGATATTTSFTLKMTSSSYYELPQPVYTGIITGLWGSANGTCYISEAT